MTDKEKKELNDGIISIFNRFNILDHVATIGGLRNDILRYIDSFQEEPVSEDLEKEYHHFLQEEWFNKPGKRTLSEQMFYTAQYFSQWQKEKMMSKAVDAIPCSILGKEIIYTDLPKEIEVGDEVKVVIIKEEK